MKYVIVFKIENHISGEDDETFGEFIDLLNGCSVGCCFEYINRDGIVMIVADDFGLDIGVEVDLRRARRKIKAACHAVGFEVNDVEIVDVKYLECRGWALKHLKSTVRHDLRVVRECCWAVISRLRQVVGGYIKPEDSDACDHRTAM